MIRELLGRYMGWDTGMRNKVTKLLGLFPYWRDRMSHMCGFWRTTLFRLTPCLVLIFVGCGVVYTGDGKFADHGFIVGADRYVVDLGPIDTTKTSSKKFTLKGLPPVRMTIGFEGGFLDKKESDLPTMHIRLVDSTKSRTVIDIKRHLRDWIWSGFSDRGETFIYYYDRKEVPHETGEENVTQDILIESTFIPSRSHSYQLLCEVITPSKKPLDLKLQVKGGGTKAEN
jgi:hypothetical protein